MPQQTNAPRRELSTAEKQSSVVGMVREGKTFRDIAVELGISKTYAHRLFHAGVDRIPAENVQAYRERQLADIELARAVVMGILGTDQFVVQNGRIVKPILGRDEDGNLEFGDPLDDPAPILAAVDRLVKLGEREAAILGSDAEKKVSMSGTVKYEVLGLADGDLA
jgi:hypothetical protein